MYNTLSDDEMTRLTHMVRQEYGQFISHMRFTEVMFALFEDIPGLEALVDTQATALINNLWVIYHDQGHYQADRSRIRCDH